MKLKHSVEKTNLTNEEQVQDLLDYYKEEYLELKSRISDLRKAQKNPIIPDLASRSIPSKIRYAENSLAKEDFEKVEELLLEVDNEIEFCEKEEVIDIPKEIEESFKTENMTEKKEVSDGSVQEEEKAEETSEEENEEETEEPKKEIAPATVGMDEKLQLEFTKIKGQLEGFAEVRTANSERFTRISEQIGELRGMIMDTNKTIGSIEVSSTKAADLVESVQPQKLMVEIRKEDGKVEALKANIESNEALMKDMFSEMKKMRSQMNFYKGIEQVTKMNADIKKDMLQMKRTEATISGHADKVETIFIEVNKKFADFDKFNDVVKDLEKTFRTISGDFEKIKVKVEEKQEKKEFIDLMNKFGEFEKHTTNLIKLLDEKSKNLKYDINARFDQIVKQLEKKFDTKLQVQQAERPPDKPLGEKMKTFFKKEKKEEKEEEPEDDGLGAGDDKPVGEAPAEESKEEKKEQI